MIYVKNIIFYLILCKTKAYLPINFAKNKKAEIRLTQIIVTYIS
jgi:hypothetical protein